MHVVATYDRHTPTSKNLLGGRFLAVIIGKQDSDSQWVLNEYPCFQAFTVAGIMKDQKLDRAWETRLVILDFACGLSCAHVHRTQHRLRHSKEWPLSKLKWLKILMQCDLFYHWNLHDHGQSFSETAQLTCSYMCDFTWTVGTCTFSLQKVIGPKGDQPDHLHIIIPLFMQHKLAFILQLPVPMHLKYKFITPTHYAYSQHLIPKVHFRPVARIFLRGVTSKSNV